jgi:hypothetical protein
VYAPGGAPITATVPEASGPLALAEAGASRGTRAGQLYGTATRDGWRAMAVRPLAGISDRLREEQLKLLPLALVLVAALVALSVWLIRQRLSPLAELERGIRRRRGAGALASRGRAGAAGRIHTAGRGERPDRAAHRSGAGRDHQ